MASKFKDFYSSMERFKKEDRKDTEICTSQVIEDGRCVEHWHDKATGNTRKVILHKNNGYLIIN